MKKSLAVALAVLSLIYLLNNCSGHMADTDKVRQATPLEMLLTMSEWVSESGAKLSFSDDFTGSSLTAPFSWSVAEDCVRVSFFPGCDIGRRIIFTVIADGGRLSLRSGDEVYTPAMLSSSGANIAEAEDQPSANELLGQQIAEYAAGFVGWKYKYGGKSPSTGFDCSGLVYYVYEQFGYRVERIADDQAEQGIEIKPENIKPGDLIAFQTSGKYVGHVGIYVGNGYYVHAMGSAYGVVLTPLDDPYLKRDYVVRRFVGCSELKLSDYSGSPAPIPELTADVAHDPASLATPSPSPTATASPAPTPTASPTPSPTPTASPSPTPTAAASPSPSSKAA